MLVGGVGRDYSQLYVVFTTDRHMRLFQHVPHAQRLYLNDSSCLQRVLLQASREDSHGSFRKLGVPEFGVLIIRILLFRVLC